MTAQSSLAILADPRHLPMPPAATMELMRLSKDENAGIREMAAVLSLDAGLAAKVIATANSVVYRRDREATTIERAIGQIGVRGIVTIALAHSVTAQLPQNGKVAGIDLGRYWKRSLSTAVTMRALLPTLPEEGFLLGLLANVGKVAMARSLGASYGILIVADDGWPSLEAEKEAFGHSCLDVTAEALDTWAMPGLFSAAVRKCSTGEIPDRENDSMLARALTVALEVAAFVDVQEHPGGEALQRARDAVERVGLEDLDIDELIRDIGTLLADAADSLALSVDDDDYHTLLDRARAQLVDLTLQADVDRQREYDRAAALEQSNKELEQQALHDSLTGISNRLAFDQAIDNHIRLRLREPEMYTKPLGVVMIDIDHFKAVNDNYGHPVGDEVLKQLGLVLKMMCRAEELVARYGGEEFILIAPIAMPDDLKVAAERIRKAIELIEVVTPSGPLTITASLGGACVQNVISLSDGARVVESADEQLYLAKNSGRNQSQIREEVMVGQADASS